MPYQKKIGKFFHLRKARYKVNKIRLSTFHGLEYKAYLVCDDLRDILPSAAFCYSAAIFQNRSQGWAKSE